VSTEIKIPEDIDIPKSSLWAKLPFIGAGLGVIGLGATFSQWGSDKEHVFFSYLFAFMFALSIALGSLAFVLIQHLVRAGWSAAVRRIAENAAMTLPVFGLLFLPIALAGMHELYPWTHTEHLDAILQKKQGYHNTSFFYIRAVVYFLVWTALAGFFYTKSTGQDSSKSEDATRAMWKASGVGVLLYGLSQTFAAFDWLMSLQPHWFSTIFGVYFFAGSILVAFTFMAMVAMGLQNGGLIKTTITTEHFHDLGKYIFGHTVFWAYIGFSQFFLIWYANIPEETEFFLHRAHHGWAGLSYALPILHFFVPFFFLLSRHVKRNRKGLFIGALYMFFMHAVDIYWLVMPNLGAHSGGEAPHAFHAVWMDVTAFIGVFGIFLAAFGFFLNRNKLVAIGDPRILESLKHQNY